MEIFSQEIKEGFIDAYKDNQSSKRRKTFSNRDDKKLINPFKNYDLLNEGISNENENDYYEYDIELLANRKLCNNRNLSKLNDEIIVCRIPKPLKNFSKKKKYGDIETKIPKL